MKINTSTNLARRALLARAGKLGIAGGAAPFALNLAAMGEAAAFSATDYKALICIFLYGGNDYGNTVIPVDAASYGSYGTVRQALTVPMADITTAGTTLTPATALANGRQYALHPKMAELAALFNTDRTLAVQLNVGTLVRPVSKAEYIAKSAKLPPKLFSHNDQQSYWQSSSPEGAASGWGGRLGDLALSNNTKSVFSCISVAGNSVFLSGNEVAQYQMTSGGSAAVSGLTTSGLFTSKACGDALRTLITQARMHPMENEYNRVMARSISAQADIAAVPALGASATALFDAAMVNGSNTLARQLQMVARLIGARDALGVKRQVFLVSMGGFDLHDNLMTTHPVLLERLSKAMNAFHKAINADMPTIANNVTTFTASDFGRTLSSNGDGSDHGWGSHHLIMGGAVKGNAFYGNAPTVAADGDDMVGQGRLLPSTSVDQLAATLAKWFGVSDSELPTIVPNIGNYSVRDLGYFA